MTTAAPTAPIAQRQPLSLYEVAEVAMGKACRGGLAGMGAMGIQVCSFMWLRTTMNYQYKNGGGARETIAKLYKEGGVRRFYRGVGPALLTGPLCRFGDTAANVGVLAFMDNTPSLCNLPVALKTVSASAAAALFRVAITPVDTIKTTLQVEGRDAVGKLQRKMRQGGPSVMFHGAMGNMTATFAGHYPWFATYNLLDQNLPAPSGLA